MKASVLIVVVVSVVAASLGGTILSADLASNGNNNNSGGHTLLTYSMVYSALSSGNASATYDQHHPNATANLPLIASSVMNYFWAVENTSQFKQNITLDNYNFTYGLSWSPLSQPSDSYFAFQTYGQEFYNIQGNLYFHTFTWSVNFGTLEGSGPNVTVSPVIYM